MVWVFLGVCVAIVFIIGFGIGFGAAGGAGDLCKGAENCQEGGVRQILLMITNISVQNYIMLTFNSPSDSSVLLPGKQQRKLSGTLWGEASYHRR